MLLQHLSVSIVGLILIDRRHLLSIKDYSTLTDPHYNLTWSIFYALEICGESKRLLLNSQFAGGHDNKAGPCIDFIIFQDFAASYIRSSYWYFSTIDNTVDPILYQTKRKLSNHVMIVRTS